MTDMEENKRAILLLVLLAFLSSFLVYQANKPYRIDGKYAASNMDTFLYMQYASAFSNGHAYRFNPEDPATTGCTSHLYPIILGLMHWIGFKSFGLLEAAFWLNVVFFLISTVLLWRIVIHLEPKGRWMIPLLFTVSGHTVMIYTGLSDMGLFVMLTLCLWLALLHERYTWTGILLFLLPFARPEGIIITGAYILMLIWEYRKRGSLPEVRQKCMALGAGLLGSVGIMILNILITGMAAFDSSVDKGYLQHMHLLTGLTHALRDTLILWKGFLLGLDVSFRNYLFIPVVSGIFIILGLFYPKKNITMDSAKKTVEAVWLSSAGLSLVMIAFSGFLGIHHDRYMLWIMPLLFIYLVRGVFALPLKRTVQIGLLSLCLMYQVAAYPYFLQARILSAGKTHSKIESVRKARDFFPAKASVAVLGGSGIKYLNPDWYVINLSGVTVPWFRKCENNMAMKIKACQHIPELQFDLFMNSPQSTLPIRAMITDSQIVETPGLFRTPLTFYNTKWESLLIGSFPMTDTLLKHLSSDLVLIDHLDAAWYEDEDRVDFELYSRYAYSREMPVLTRGAISGNTLVDAARPVIGGAFYTLNTVPRKDHWFVFRIALDENVIFKGLEGMQSQRINTRNVQFLTFTIWDRYQVKTDMTDINDIENIRFLERMVCIPGKVITSTQTEFGIIGDHLLCDVWLYTKPH